MDYAKTAIAPTLIPQTRNPLLQHLLETYVSESNKVVSVWHCFTPEDLPFKPRQESSSVAEILKHQLLSERRFFGQFLGTPEPPPERIVPDPLDIESAVTRFVQLAVRRLPFFAAQSDEWWIETVPFFDVSRERIWIFWRRVLHTAHHRTQLTVYLRLMGRPVPATYGPTADVTWSGADPTNTVEAAGRS